MFVPGCYDCISSALLEEAGFPALFISGAGVSASVLGMPDLGLLSFHELAQAAGNIIRRSQVPVIVDADTGFGNELNTYRTVTELGALGAAAVVIEDQVSPKRCGHMSGKDVVTRSAFRGKIRAARRACDEYEMLLIARTDAIAVTGVDDALSRATDAADAGADITFVEAPRTLAEVRQVGTNPDAQWKLYNAATGGRSPALSVTELAAQGFSLVLEPAISLYPAIHGIRAAAKQVLHDQSSTSLLSFGMTPRDIFEAVGLAEWSALDDALGNTAVHADRER